MEMAHFTEVQALWPVGIMASWKLEQEFGAAAQGLASQVFFSGPNSPHAMDFKFSSC